MTINFATFIISSLTLERHPTCFGNEKFILFLMWKDWRNISLRPYFGVMNASTSWILRSLTHLFSYENKVTMYKLVIYQIFPLKMAENILHIYCQMFTKRFGCFQIDLPNNWVVFLLCVTSHNALHNMHTCTYSLTIQNEPNIS
jgi:hypothetical protein